MRKGIPFAPTKIDVGQLTRFIAQEEQEGSNRIGYGGRHGAEHAIAVEFWKQNQRNADDEATYCCEPSGGESEPASIPESNVDV